MKYPHFAEALRGLAPTLKGVAERIGRSERQASYYLTGNAMPPADITARVPELYVALRRDLGLADQLPYVPIDNRILIAA